MEDIQVVENIEEVESEGEVVENINIVEDAELQAEIDRLKAELREAKMQAEIDQLRKELAEAKEAKQTPVTQVGSKETVKKNQKPGKPDPNRKYVLMCKTMPNWGKIPQQQADVADILSKNMEVGKEYSEAEVFNMLINNGVEYPSIAKSVQDPTYLFRFYRGLKNDGQRGGYTARNFLRKI
jgi:ribosomal protein L29